MSMKILHIITKLELGGAQKNTLFTLSNLDKNDRGFLLAGKGGILDKEAVNAGKYIVRFCPFLKRQINPLYDMLAFFWIYFYLLSLRPQIVHTHSSKAGIVGRLAAAASGCKIIIHTFHGFGFTPLQRPVIRNLFIFLERITAKVSDKLLTVAHANIDKALEVQIGRRSQYEVIRSGIDINSFRELADNSFDIHDELGIERETKLIGNISCFKPQKGLFDYIDAIEMISRETDASFLMVGDGALREEIENRIKEKRLDSRIYVMGWRKDVGSILKELTVVLHTAYFEGLPRVLLEAIATKTAVVATNVDGATDIIEHGKNGYLVNPGDIKGMARYTIELLKNPELNKRFCENAFYKLREEFDIKNMSKKLNELYLNLTQGELMI